MKCPVCNKENNDNSKFCGGCGANLSTETVTGRLDPQTMLDNRYVVLRTLGQGGMGAVYLALDTRLNNMPVAIKEMSTRAVGGDLQAAIASFQKEAQMLISLRHPALPVIYDFFSREENRWYLVMDYIQGDTLKAETQKRGRIPEAVVVNWAMQLCDILEYLHKRNPPVIFRDLKPDNIMLTPEGQIKLIDFGIARNFQPGNSADTVAYGSGGFSPPEQYGQNQTDARSDIYALAATLHYLLTGIDPVQNPFRFEPPSKYTAISAGLEKAIMQALDLSPENRPQTIGAFKALLSESFSDANSLPVKSSVPGEMTADFLQESNTVPLSVDHNQLLNAPPAGVGVGPSRPNTPSYTVEPRAAGYANSNQANKSWLVGGIVAALILLIGGGTFWYFKMREDVDTPKVSSSAKTTESSNLLVLPDNTSSQSQSGSTPSQNQYSSSMPTTDQIQTDYDRKQSTLEELNKGEQLAAKYDEIRVNLIRMLTNLANGQGSVSEYYKTCSTATAERQALLNEARSLSNRSTNPAIHKELINMLNYSLEYCTLARQGGECVERDNNNGLDQKLNELQACSERIQSSLDSYKATIQQERSRL
jgi:serine/threonine protein kinase